MSFLAPLYLLAGLAVGLPIFFHLIRQTPKGRQVFSSVMFLEPSPPRVTQRSKIEDWLLLLLRALAVCLLAFAFARPFFRSQALANQEGAEGARIVVLLDTSASMRREGYWENALQRVDTVVRSTERTDSLALLTFDGETQTVMTFEDWLATDADARSAAILERLEEIQPTWRATELGTAMISGAELLDEESEKSISERKLIIISDLQSGSRWEPLNGYDWPQGVRVQFERLGGKAGKTDATNATLHVVADDEQDPETVRVRVSNSSDATRDLFHVSWQGTFDRGAAAPKSGTAAYVPPGQSRVIRAPVQTNEVPSQRLVVTDDAHDFDNTCFVATTVPWQVKIVYVGTDAPDDTSGLRFFLGPVFPSAPGRNVTIVDAAEDLPLSGASLVVIGGQLESSVIEPLREWLRSGGQAIFVATDAEQAIDLYTLLDLPPQPVTEPTVPEYSLLQNIDFSHPVLSQFDDPRFSDFTKLRYWRHRVIDVTTISDWRPLASFDDGSPAWGEVPIGKGRVVAMTAGWNRDDSELAVSTKFVPLMNRLLEYGSRRTDVRPQFLVGDEITIEKLGYSTEQLVIRQPDDETVTLSTSDSLRLESPGIYRMAATESELDSDSQALAVNLTPEESETSPLPIERLEATGVLLANANADKTSVEEERALQRQLMSQELEAQQQLWKWLLVAALGVLLAETLLGGILTRRRLRAA